MSTPDSGPEGERLQKVLAAAGVASRRVVEEMIVARRIRVNGEVADELGRRIDPATDAIEVDGVAVQLDTTRRYVMLNKPVGVVSSLADENGRADLSTYTQNFEERLFNVGRLDAETSGLLVLTNDGELAHVLAHPSFGVTKTYIAKVQGHVLPQTIAALTAGVELDDGPVSADKARLLGRPEGKANASLVEITLHSGRNRVVRRMLAAVGHPVLELVRRQFGPLHLGALRSGDLRDLTRDELGALLTISRQGHEKVAAEKPEPTRKASAGARRPRPRVEEQGRSEERSRSEERPRWQDRREDGAPARERRDSGERRSSEERRPAPERRDSGERRPSAARRDSGERRPAPERRDSGERRPASERRDSGERRPSPERRDSGERRLSDERRDSADRRPPAERRDSGERRASDDRRSSSAADRRPAAGRRSGPDKLRRPDR